MLNVMLVDDEPLALEGLKLLVDWAAEGFSVCVECPNAGEALRLLVPAHPDLIVTDLRMPGMDGLELMLATKAQGFDGQFVVVSGYGDFEYAQRAEYWCSGLSAQTHRTHGNLSSAGARAWQTDPP